MAPAETTDSFYIGPVVLVLRVADLWVADLCIADLLSTVLYGIYYYTYTAPAHINHTTISISRRTQRFIHWYFLESTVLHLVIAYKQGGHKEMLSILADQ
jgi:hypothetical protein